MKIARQFGFVLLLLSCAVAQDSPALRMRPDPPSNRPQGAAEATAADATGTISVVEDANQDLRTVFKIRYVAADAVYLDGGRSAGLAEGVKLVVREPMTAKPRAATAETAAPAAGNDLPGVVAELVVLSVAETSAVARIQSPKRALIAGDIASLSSADQEALVQKNALSATRKYPMVISFTEGDTLDDEAREEVPRPPLPSVNRARGRFGLDYSGVSSPGRAGSTSSNVGVVFRGDITRINGTYWNLSGYWRGSMNTHSGAGTQTLQNLLNRTYHLSLSYQNPNSAWVAGVGRLFLPWASSLDTIDGGYFGRRVHPGVTLGVFAGSTPDPTSYNYNPDRKIGGTFVNFEGGSYDDLHYTSTSGFGISTLKWQIDRPFVFFENGIFYKQKFSVYHSLQADSPKGNAAVTAPGTGIGRSFLTVRFQPVPRVELTLNHSYFRDVPTFDPSLIGTGLLDKYLFQGFSVGARVEVHKQIWLYGDLGRSSRSGDAKTSLNELFGVTLGRVPFIATRADFRYSKFNSSFGAGSYSALSLSRSFNDNLRFELLAGKQSFTSTLAGTDSAKFVTFNAESALGPHYFIQSGITVSRGRVQNYNQWNTTLGYRFDSKGKAKTK